MNNRKQIRAAILERLDSLVLDGDPVPVFDARYMSFKTVPVVVVYTPGDIAEKSADEQANIRQEEIQIAVYAGGIEAHEEPESGELTVIEKIDDITGQIENEFSSTYEVLRTATFPDGVVYRMNYKGTKIATKVDGTEIKTIATINYQARVNEKLVRP